MVLETDNGMAAVFCLIAHMSNLETNTKNMAILAELAADSDLIEHSKSQAFWLMTRHSDLDYKALTEMITSKLN